MAKHKVAITTVASLLSGQVLTSAHAITINSQAIFESKLQSQINIPSHFTRYPVKTAEQAIHALKKAHQQGGFSAIIFADGIYQFRKMINISAPSVMLLSESALPNKVVLRGNGMKATKGVDNLIRVSGKDFVIDGLTLEQAGNHLLQIAGEAGANSPTIRNSIFQDGYEQLIKITYSRKHAEKHSAFGAIENSFFRYSAGIGPNYYIGGIDAHGIKNWQIKNNTFENIASPSKRIAEHAIHLWNDTADNIVENNWIINSDRGIGFGMRKNKKGYVNYSNFAGLIKGNIIYHENNHHKSADVGIILEDSPNTYVIDNIIFTEHQYSNAIEFRFPQTKNIRIERNKVNKYIKSRKSAKAQLKNNIVKQTMPAEIKKYAMKGKD